MKNIIITLYSFNELTKAAQPKALNDLRTINVDHSWWDSTYEDAKTIGLDITGFDLDRNKHAQGNIIGTAEETAKLIKENHGEDCDTYKLAETFLTAFYIIDGQLQADAITSHLIDELEGTQEDLAIDFKNDLLKEYANILQKESDYLLSDEAVKETIEANEYTFEENGRMNNSKVEHEQEEPAKVFPNGFTSWIETHHEIVNAIAIQQQLEIGLSYQVACQRGTGGLYELAEALTDKFETIHKDTEWDGEFYETIEEFLTEELKEKE